MVQKDGSAERQHYVPQFLLKNFCGNKLYAFDVPQRRSYAVATKNVAREWNFYRAKDDTESIDLESYLTGIEEDSAPLIVKIIECQTLKDLTLNELHQLSRFFACQFLRTKQCREQMSFVYEQISKNGDNEVFSNEQLEKLLIKAVALTTPALSSYVLNKAWVLLQTNNENFMISDNPVVRTSGGSLSAGIGFGSNTVQIYCPISANLCLGFWGDTVWRNMVNSAECYMKAKALRDNPVYRQKVIDHYEKLGVSQVEFDEQMEFYVTILKNNKDGCAVSCHRSFVRRLNTLQMISATRHLFSSTDNFSVYEKVLKPQFTLGSESD